MRPITGVPAIMAQGMKRFRGFFCRAEGVEPVCRVITGLILRPNQTLQGSYDAQVWEGEAPSRRARHEAVFESGGNSAALLQPHRTEVAQASPGRGRQVIALAWTLSPHARGPKIEAVTQGYDDVERRTTWFQTGVTAVVSHRDGIDGLEVIAQDPKHWRAAAAYLTATLTPDDAPMAEGQPRLQERLHDPQPRLESRQRTELAVAIGRQREAEGPFSEAH